MEWYPEWEAATKHQDQAGKSWSVYCCFQRKQTAELNYSFASPKSSQASPKPYPRFYKLIMQASSLNMLLAWAKILRPWALSHKSNSRVIGVGLKLSSEVMKFMACVRVSSTTVPASLITKIHIFEALFQVAVEIWLVGPGGHYWHTLNGTTCLWDCHHTWPDGWNTLIHGTS